MNAFNNIEFVASKKNDISVAELNSMVSNMPYNKFFSRTAVDGTTVLVRGPRSFASWLKTKSNYSALVKWGKGPRLGKTKQAKFKGLFWREERQRLYVMFDNRTIPWSNWVSWCEKKHSEKTLKV
jgi:hypothetical protein